MAAPETPQSEQQVPIERIYIKPCYSPAANHPESPYARLMIQLYYGISPATIQERAYIKRVYPEVFRMLSATADMVHS